jgi:hypothetical protein
VLDLISFNFIIFLFIVFIIGLVLLNTKKIDYTKNRFKGEMYEIKVANYYKKLGYEVDQRGLKKKLKDEGIDLIVYKNSKTLLIQCKNWQKEKSIYAKHIKEFYGSCHLYMENNSINKNSVLCIYAIPNEKLLNKFSLDILKKNYSRLRYTVI